MSETVNQEKATVTPTPEQKTFTQDELNAILNDRLGREKQKYSDYEAMKEKAKKLDELEEASKSELQKANEKASALESELKELKKANEIRAIRDEVAKAQNVPADLLTADTKEACEAQAKALMAFASSKQGYPTLVDGGEAGSDKAGSTRELFAGFMQNNL